MVLGCLGAPLVIMRAGHIRAFAALVSLMSAAAILHPVLIDPYAWMIIRMISGFSLAGFYMIVESWLNESASNENRGTVMSFYIVILFGALMLGQISIASMNIADFIPFAIASVMVSLAVMPVSLTTSTQPAPITLVRFQPVKLYKNSPAAFIGVLFIGSSQGALLTLSSLYGSQIGLSTKEAAFYAAAIVGGGLIAQWPVGRLSDRIDRRLVIAGLGIATAAVSAAIVFFSPKDFTVAIPERGGHGHGRPTALCNRGCTRLRPRGSRKNFVATSSGMLLSFGIGSIIGAAGRFDDHEQHRPVRALHHDHRFEYPDGDLHPCPCPDPSGTDSGRKDRLRIRPPRHRSVRLSPLNRWMQQQKNTSSHLKISPPTKTTSTISNRHPMQRQKKTTHPLKAPKQKKRRMRLQTRQLQRADTATPRVTGFSPCTCAVSPLDTALQPAYSR